MLTFDCEYAKMHNRLVWDLFLALNCVCCPAFLFSFSFYLDFRPFGHFGLNYMHWIF